MEARFWSRDTASTHGTLSGQPMEPEFNDPVMTHRELLILRSIAIFAASISLISGLLVGYWFIRMKRSFRHQYVYLLLNIAHKSCAAVCMIENRTDYYNSLIMLLICSDFWKASWQLIYPAVVITTGNADRGSPFCQVTGFFISMGIEASGNELSIYYLDYVTNIE